MFKSTSSLAVQPAVQEEVAMPDERPALEWYRSCIHERQRRATTLSIEVGLHSADREDPDSLAETMAYLDDAIAVLEQAEAVGRTAFGREHAARERSSSQSQRLMDDLGHSMAIFSLAPLQFEHSFTAAGEGWRGVSVEESLRFFE